MTRRRSPGCGRAGAVLAAQTTASEFGGINCTSTELHGTTRNPWDLSRTPGGSSGGTAAAVAGGLLPIATGSDGGGLDPHPGQLLRVVRAEGHLRAHPQRARAPASTPLTSVLGCLSRSVRDTARFFDACSGFDQRDPLSLPDVGWLGGGARHPRPRRPDRRHRPRPGNGEGARRGRRRRGRVRGERWPRRRD